MSSSDPFEAAVIRWKELNSSSDLLCYDYDKSHPERFAFSEAVELMPTESSDQVIAKRRFTGIGEGPGSSAQDKGIPIRDQKAFLAVLKQAIPNSRFSSADVTQAYDQLIYNGTYQLTALPTRPPVSNASLFDLIDEKAVQSESWCKVCATLDAIGFAFAGKASAADVATNGPIWKLCHFLLDEINQTPTKEELEPFDFLRWTQPLFRPNGSGGVDQAGLLFTYGPPSVDEVSIRNVHLNGQIAAAQFLIDVTRGKPADRKQELGSDNWVGKHFAALMGRKICPSSLSDAERFKTRNRYATNLGHATGKGNEAKVLVDEFVKASLEGRDGSSSAIEEFLLQNLVVGEVKTKKGALYEAFDAGASSSRGAK